MISTRLFRRVALLFALLIVLFSATSAPVGALTPEQRVLLFNGQPFNPNSIPGLVRAWQPDIGVSPGTAGSVTSVRPAFGTSVPLTTVPGNEPDLVLNAGPNGQPLFKFTSANVDYFNFSQVSLPNGATVVAVVSATKAANMTLIGNSGAGATGSHIRLNTPGAGSTFTSFQARTTGDVVNTVLLTPEFINKSLEIVVFTYSAATQTFQPITDGYSSTATVCGGAPCPSGFTFSQLGTRITGTDLFEGLMGPVYVYNRALLASEVQQLTTFLTPWRSKTFYWATTGVDGNFTPWLTTTPFASLAQFITFPFHGDETSLFNNCQVWRPTANHQPTVAGRSASTPLVIDGSSWGGCSKAQIRASNAVVVSPVLGDIYSAPLTYDPGTPTAPGRGPYVFFLGTGSSGVVTFGPNYTLNNMKRLARTAGVQTAPGAGEWGWALNVLYMNAGSGIVITTGDIEVPFSTAGGFKLSISQNNWVYKGLIAAFNPASAWVVTDLISVQYGIEAWFAAGDGFDGVGTAQITRVGTVAAYSGDADDDFGQPVGDGYSDHINTASTNSNIFCYWNGKSCVSSAGGDGAGITIDRMFSIGPTALHLGNAPTSGIVTVSNAVIFIAAGYTNTDAVLIPGSQPTLINLYDSTIVSLSSPAAGTGLSAGSLSPVVLNAKNVIVQGFATDMTAGLSHSYVISYNNTTTNGGTQPGDKLVNPLLTNISAYDATIPANSPAYGAGVAIPGVPTNYLGAIRGNPPNIGAY